MTATIIPGTESPLTSLTATRMDRLSRILVVRQLRKLDAGCLVIREAGAEMVFGRATADFPLTVTVDVHDPGFYTFAAFGGSVGAGESYMAGHWTTDDLTGLVRIILRNTTVFDQMDRGWSRLTGSLNRFVHALRRNTRRGSKDNIVAHYDLGNDFYSLFLDDTLTYSSGIFETPDATLKEASIAKYDRICRKLELGPEDRVIEIGTGWGGFAIHAAKNYGCHVTTTTISDAQFEEARKRIAAAGLESRITLLNDDYRDLTGEYDKLVSIEMIEAVGREFLDAFLETCGRLLKPDGEMLLQAIVIADHAFDRASREVDFIKRYIFPGSCIPSTTAIGRAMAKTTDMRLTHMEDITAHYARTLKEWRANFFNRINEVRALGFDERFIRMWEFYLSYCEGGFAERYIGDVQMIFSKPLNRQDPILPSLS